MFFVIPAKAGIGSIKFVWVSRLLLAGGVYPGNDRARAGGFKPYSCLRRNDKNYFVIFVKVYFFFAFPFARFFKSHPARSAV